MADVKIPKMLGSMSHTYQKAWYKRNKMELPAHLQRASSAGKVDTTRTKQAQQQSLKAYGATKGTRTGSAEGTGEELKDTVKPLTPEQHAKINAAKRASEGKPLTKDQRMSIIARSVRKAQSKHDVPTLDNNDAHNDVRHDHDLMHVVGVRHSYNEGFDPSSAEIAKMLVDKHGPNVTKDHIKELEDERDSHSGLDHEEIMKHVKKMTESVATAQKVMDRANVVAKTNPDPKKRFAAGGLAHKAMLRTINPTGVNTGIVRGGGNKTYRMLTGKVPPYQLTPKTGVSEEVGQVNEMDSEGYRGHRGDEDPGKGPAKYVKPVTTKKTLDDAAKVLAKSFAKDKVKKEEVELDEASVNHREYASRDLMHPNMAKIMKPGENVDFYSHDTSKLSGMVTKNDGKFVHIKADPHHGGKLHMFKVQPHLPKTIKVEEVEVNEGAKEDAEKLLGGPVKTRTGNEPKGKLPLGFRQARNLARQAMKAGKSVTESTTEVSEVNEMSHGKALAKMIMAKKSKHPIAQHMGEAKDPGEYDYEGDMAMSQLKSVIANAQKLHDMMDPDTNLPEWVQAKITLAEDYIVTAANYMDGQMDESAFAELDAELELFEKAPPGSKYERMVKHIKKGYSAGGLTPKEKSIAYATAWKAYNKANEEVEQIDELDRKTRVSYLKKSLTQLNNIASSRHTTGNKTYGSKEVGKRLAGLSRLERSGGHSASVRDNIDKARARFEEVEQINEGPSHFRYTGEVNGKPYEYTVRAHSDLTDDAVHKALKRDNDHLEPHEIKAIVHSGGEEESHVDVTHNGKKYTHHVINEPEPDHLHEEVEQIDELKDSTLKSYVKKANKEMNKAFKYHKMDQGGRDGTDPEYMKKTYPWALAKFDRRDAGVEKAKQKLAKEETEGSIPTTPKEKELAKHHGDPNRITFGDVLKARLKSAAAKKMGK